MIKTLCFFWAMIWMIPAGNGQPIQELVLNAYFDVLVQQMEINGVIAQQLQQLSPTLDQEYQHLISIPNQDDALLPWIYFFKKLENEKGGNSLVEWCKEGQKTDKVVRLFHSRRVVDAFSQTTIDTAQSMQRLLFFDLAEGDKVAEIGFGYGYNLNLLGLVYENIEIYANELDAYRLKKMEQEIGADFPANRRDNFHFIAGSKTSTNLEGKELDLIIMENVLHHIEDKVAFIKSLAESIQEKGSIIIIEEFLDLRPGSKVCPDLMDRASLKQLFEAADFELLEYHDLEDQYKTMLRFVKKVIGQLEVVR